MSQWLGRQRLQPKDMYIRWRLPGINLFPTLLASVYSGTRLYELNLEFRATDVRFLSETKVVIYDLGSWFVHVLFSDACLASVTAYMVV
jgi:hypothetical protein